MCRKTQWDLPSWDSSPSSEEEHPGNVTVPDNTSVAAISYTKVEEVRCSLLVSACAFVVVK